MSRHAMMSLSIILLFVYLQRRSFKTLAAGRRPPRPFTISMMSLRPCCQRRWFVYFAFLHSLLIKSVHSRCSTECRGFDSDLNKLTHEIPIIDNEASDYWYFKVTARKICIIETTSVDHVLAARSIVNTSLSAGLRWSLIGIFWYSNWL